MEHTPVLLNEVIKALDIKEDGTYLDFTVGLGGHAYAILSKLRSGQLIGFDADKLALSKAEQKLSQLQKPFRLVHDNYGNFLVHLKNLNIEQVDGVLIDLGFSSMQVDEPDRGFSYRIDAPLDMRMDTSASLSAKVVVNEWSLAELSAIFTNYAESPFSQRLAKAIISSRPINTTLKLVEVIRSALPAAVVRKKNPAKAIFQALRMAVNHEHEALTKALANVLPLLKKHGTFGVITFNSVEDKTVKLAWHKLIAKTPTPSALPVQVVVNWSVKSFTPSKAEIASNNRARSAKLRVLTKL